MNVFLKLGSMLLAFLFVGFLISGCQSGAKAESLEARMAYPSHWWKSYPLETKPVWEILPSEAGPGEVILSKRNELGIFSNFTYSPFTFRGKKYLSVEGFWQMMLYPENAQDPRAKDAAKFGVKWKFERESVAGMVAFEAKVAGGLAEENMKKMGILWASFEGKRFPYRSLEKGEHYRLIYAAMCEKLKQNSAARELLLATGDLILRPDHHPEENAPPEWKYFDLWMEFREILKQGRELKCEG
jgi:hypothetical protein